MAMNTAPATIDEYIAGFPEPVREKLEKMRAVIRKAAPAAKEKIGYGIPTFTLEGNLVHFGGYKNHIGFYPAPRGLEEFAKELSGYKGSKGTVQFPLDKPLPLALIAKIVKFRVKQNIGKSGGKKKMVNPIARPVKLKKLSDEEQVEAYLNKLEPAAKAEINTVRKIIKTASSKLNERIKWNAPSYYYKDDILTFGPYKTHKLLLVFHHPAVVKVKSTLLEGDYPNRRLVYLKNKADVAKNKKELSRIINEIIKTIDKK